MKKPILLLIFLTLFITLCFANTYTQTQFQNATSGIEGETEGSPLEIIKNWQALAVIALIISCILVAIAYAVGTGMEMPEIKAWAGNELGQIFANAVIILMFIVAIGFVDTIVSAMVMTSGLNIPECSVPGGSCLRNVTDAYLYDYIETAKTGARSVLINNIDAASWANRRMGLNCLTIYCLQLGLTTTMAGQYVLDMDMYAIMFEYYTNLLSFMEAQRFFVNQISFKMGPIILALGIIARTFYFTRKLGGLLIAVAAGIMFFLPGMYIFDWVTLDMAMTGDKAMEDENVYCPDECKAAPPLAYKADGEKLETVQEIYAALPEDNAAAAKELIEGSLESTAGRDGTLVFSCYYEYSEEDCPSVCRALPYPYNAVVCLNTSTVERDCAHLNENCKVVRYVNTEASSFDNDTYNKCPSMCKVVPPLRSNCDVDDCLESRYDCRVYKRTGSELGSSLTWWPTPNEDAGNYHECLIAQNCPVNLVAEQSCAYVIPEIGTCNDEAICGNCPAYCRIDNNPNYTEEDQVDFDQLPDDCKDETGTVFSEACMNCPNSCKVRKHDILEITVPEGMCSACPAEKRIVTPSLPEEYTTDGCSLDLCPGEYRVVVPRSSCEMCLFAEESYAYDPPIQTQCADICKPPDNAPIKDAGSYMNIGEDGLVGREGIKNIAKLILPIYLLPLFNIVATLVFIKGLSTILGGDIEIPGISKVF
ncbi:hypothetical protein KKF81_01290 [Candidatus Micrarchaeota archaeon]|nr:hypothetical protein [Candidatus Micrarchaeota archaeon]MBU1165554.1 hypothetical protein [Candidatus Micrarchaeota archaeon]MBU1886503.1 hypothetical protein [Candidatus Micrarchaeota archaeon]